MYQFIWKWVQKYSILLADRFVIIIGKSKVQKIFADDETLLKINDQHCCWFRLLAYQPNLHVFAIPFIYKRKNDPHMLPVL